MTMVTPPHGGYRHQPSGETVAWREAGLIDPWDEEATPLPSWLVDGLIPSNTIFGIYGQPKQGKTFVGSNLAVSLASTEATFLDRAVAPGPHRVLYAYAEGDLSRALAQRLRTIDPEGSAAEKLTIYQPVGSGFVHGNEQAQAHFQQALHLFDPNVVIIDPLRKAFTGDENSSTDVNRVFDGINRLVREGRTVVLIAHSAKPSKDGRSYGPMGSQAIAGNIRAWVQVARNRKRQTMRLTFEGNDVPQAQLEVALQADLTLAPINGSTAASVTTAHEANQLRLKQKWLAMRDHVGTAEWPYTDLIRLCVQQSVGKQRTAKQYIADWTKVGYLRKIEAGRYVAAA